MHSTPSDKSRNPNIWRNIDILKVKQRIDAITHQLERVRRQEEALLEEGNYATDRRRASSQDAL